jgi:manganese transport protein
LSQVVLSLQLPFAIIPLIQFTSNKRKMGEFASPMWVQALAWITAAIIVGLNMRLAAQTLEPLGWWAILLVAPVLALLLYVCVSPWLGPDTAAKPDVRTMPEPILAPLSAPHYKKILVPLDHSDNDRPTVSHAAALALQHDAQLLLLHVEEGVTSQVYGELSETGEVEAGTVYLARLAQELAAQGVKADVRILHAKSPREAIVKTAQEEGVDLLIMGAHGHSGLKDLVFGSTINSVRHGVKAPVLIVR